jgi:hypothetical protein
MKRALVLCLAAACARATPGEPDACVPGTGPASWLAGSWAGIPEHPTDWGVNLDLEGTANGICGVATHWAGGADAGFPTPVSGTEQSLHLDGYVYGVVPRDLNHFGLGPDGGSQLEFTRR